MKTSFTCDEMLAMAARLRHTVSESKRTMLDTAAQMLEEAAQTAPIVKPGQKVAVYGSDGLYHDDEIAKVEQHGEYTITLVQDDRGFLDTDLANGVLKPMEGTND